jgi:hypothetical protein
MNKVVGAIVAFVLILALVIFVVLGGASALVRGVQADIAHCGLFNLACENGANAQGLDGTTGEPVEGAAVPQDKANDVENPPASAGGDEVDPNKIFVGGPSHSTFELASGAKVGDRTIEFAGAVIPTFPIDRSTRIIPDSRYGVTAPGEGYMIAGITTTDFDEVTICRYWVDDIADEAYVRLPNDEEVSFLVELGMISVPAGYDGEAVPLFEILGINTTDGELLPQNSKVVRLTNIPAGTVFAFRSHDDADLGFNTGAGLHMNCDEFVDIPDSFVNTIDLSE